MCKVAFRARPTESRRRSSPSDATHARYRLSQHHIRFQIAATLDRLRPSHRYFFWSVDRKKLILDWVIIHDVSALEILIESHDR